MAGSPPFPESSPVRLWLVPVGSTLAASCVTLFPLVVATPWVPPFGLLVALAWRLLRPEMWGAWVALPLGLFDDLVGGAPLGSAAALWTLAFLGLDLADHRMIFRDQRDDWRLATVALAGCEVGAWGLTRFAGAAGPGWTVLPQFVLSLLLFPATARMCARLDRWRLRKGTATRA